MSVGAASAAELLANQSADAGQQSALREYDETFLQNVVLQLGTRVGMNISNVIEDITVERSVEGASTVVVKTMDYERQLLKTGNLKKSLDIEIDKLFFRLTGFDKNGDHLDLNFETREIAYLRSYPKTGIGPGDVLENGPLGPFSRDQMTRAEFVLMMIREVKEEKIKWIIPQLHRVQPIESSTDILSVGSTYVGTPGLSSPTDTSVSSPADQHHHPGDTATANNLTVKGERATNEQVRNANIIIQVGTSMNARRKVLVTAIMTAIQESTLSTAAENGGHLGLFQQDSGWGSVSDRKDAATSARLFFESAIKADKKLPGLTYYGLAEEVQHSGLPEKYAPWRTEGERFVTDYGLAGGDTTTGNAKNAGGTDLSQLQDGAYYFYRGLPPTSNQKPWHREDSWTAIQRLADEVQWRAFFVGDVFYFLDEFTLFRTLPRMTFGEFSPGITQIDCNYDTRKKNATITVTARLGKWGAPPGAVVFLTDVGPLNGRWLVESVSRSLFDPYAQITLSKPRPSLPEPAGSNLPTSAGSAGAGAPVPGVPAAGSGTYVSPFGGSSNLRPERIDQGVDYSGTGPIRAVGDGKILGVYNSGWPNGVYIMLELTDGPRKGQIVFYAEDISPAVHVGQTVQAGQTIGTFSGGPNGIEVGWSSPVSGLVADPYNGRPDGTKTEGGKDFARFLQSLGVPTVSIG